MYQEGDPSEVKKASLEPKTPTADDPDSISPFGSDPSLSEEEVKRDRGIITLSDEEIIESIYESLLQIILSVRLQQGNAETWCLDDCQTPLLRVTKMVPGTCPGAPLKPTKISRSFGSGSGRSRRILF